MASANQALHFSAYHSVDRQDYLKIRCIFYAEFHPTAGPIVKFSEPEGYFDTPEQRALFESVSSFIIPKPELKNCFVCVSSERFKIVGCPNVIENPMYQRNAYMFNICLLFDIDCMEDVTDDAVQCGSFIMQADIDAERERACDVSAYEKIVRKIASAFRTLELESGTLTNDAEHDKVRQFLQRVMRDLNERGTCLLELSETNAVYLSLKPEFVSRDDVPVANEDVPVLVTPLSHALSSVFPDIIKSDGVHVGPTSNAADNLVMPEFMHDLTMKQILPCIDGISHVKRIAEQLDMDQGIVKLALQNLLYYGVIKLVPIFKHSNMYMPTARVTRLLYDKDLQRDCINQISTPLTSTAAGPAVDPRKVFRIYCGMEIGVTVRDLCLRYAHDMEFIVPHKLIEFGLVHGLIRAIRKYPCFVGQQNVGNSKTYNRYANDFAVLSLMNGANDEDKLLCATETSPEHLAAMIDSDSRIVTILK